jgi:hypothetical protein
MSKTGIVFGLKVVKKGTPADTLAWNVRYIKEYIQWCESEVRKAERTAVRYKQYIENNKVKLLEQIDLLNKRKEFEKTLKKSK